MMLSIDCKKIFCHLITFFLNSVWNECVNGLKIVIVARDYKTDTRTKTETEMIRVKINYICILKLKHCCIAYNGASWSLFV